MRVAFDARALSWAGIGTYTRSLLQHFSKQKNGIQFTVIVTPESVQTLREIILGSAADQFQIQVVKAKYYSIQEQTRLWYELNRIRADIFHFTHFNIPFLFNKPYITTVHDITRFIFPGQKRQTLRQQVAYEFVFKRAVEGARALIAVSETTRRELNTLSLQLPPKVRVIREGVAAEYFDNVTADLRQKVRMLLGTADPYILYVGVWMNHKNLRRILESFALIKKEFPTLKLVLTGKPKPGYNNVIEIARELNVLSDIIFAGFVIAPLLPALYAEAAVFLFPSLYEGFGLPPLEAMASGTPVIASNVSSLPELLGHSALLVNPEYVAGIVDGLRLLLTDAPFRTTLIAKGKMQARQYSWSDTAAEHIRLYKEVLN